MGGVRLNTALDIRKLLARTVREVRGNKITVERARCIGYLCGHLLKTVELVDVQNAIDELKEKAERWEQQR
jgi:hypothetical protein